MRLSGKMHSISIVKTNLRKIFIIDLLFIKPGGKYSFIRRHHPDENFTF
jgi:hypothetical protein